MPNIFFLIQNKSLRIHVGPSWRPMKYCIEPNPRKKEKAQKPTNVPLLFFSKPLLLQLLLASLPPLILPPPPPPLRGHGRRRNREGGVRLLEEEGLQAHRARPPGGAEQELLHLPHRPRRCQPHPFHIPVRSPPPPRLQSRRLCASFTLLV